MPVKKKKNSQNEIQNSWKNKFNFYYTSENSADSTENKALC